MIRPVIIGGGFAGLSAAVQLAAQGLQPLVLEARPHLGGRAYSFTDGATGEQIDNGQHAMMGCYTHALAFLERIGATRKLVRQSNLRVAMAERGGGAGVIACPALPGPLHMIKAVLGYRLLGRRDRWRALLGGVRIRGLYRRAPARLVASTVAELLATLGQSAHAQASFWNPVAIATLNETPARASAAPFAAVLARAFFGARRDSQFVLPRVGLSELYTDDARRFIETHGGRVELRAAVAQLDLRDGRIAAVSLRDGRRIATDACIAAVPPPALAAVVPEPLRDVAPFRTLGGFVGSPIVSIHLWLDRPVFQPDFLGLLGTTTQWIFNRSALRGEPNGGQSLSAVISAGHEVVDWDNARIAATAIDDLQAVVPAARAAQVTRSVVVRERNATISNTPAAERLRPSAHTPIANLFLAGDWTATGLPPTIESAAASGDRAAALLVERLQSPRL